MKSTSVFWKDTKHIQISKVQRKKNAQPLLLNVNKAGELSQALII